MDARPLWRVTTRRGHHQSRRADFEPSLTIRSGYSRRSRAPSRRDHGIVMPPPSDGRFTSPHRSSRPRGPDEGRAMPRLRPNLTRHDALPDTLPSRDLPAWGQPIARVMLAGIGLIIFGMGMPSTTDLGINHSVPVVTTHDLDETRLPDLPLMPLVRVGPSWTWDKRQPAARVAPRIRQDGQGMTCPRSSHDLAATACAAASRLPVARLAPQLHNSDDRIARSLFATAPLPVGEPFPWIGRQPDAIASGREDDPRWDLMEMAGASRHREWPPHCPCPISPRANSGGTPR